MSDQTTDELLAEMQERVEAERAEILKETDSTVREIEERATRECERLERETIAELEAELKAERDRVLGVVRDEMRRERLATKRTAAERAFEAARKEIAGRVEGDGYASALKALIREGAAFVGAGATVRVSDKELPRCREIVSSLGLDCAVTGGGERGSLELTSADGRRRVENGVFSRLHRAQEKLSADVSRILFG